MNEPEKLERLRHGNIIKSTHGGEKVGSGECLHCLCIKLQACVDEAPPNIMKMHEIIFKAKTEFEHPDMEGQDRTKFFNKIVACLEAPSFDLDEMKTLLINSSFVADYRGRKGEYF